MPNDVQDRIYTKFLFDDFLKNYRKLFTLEKVSPNGTSGFYSFAEDISYRNTVIDIMQKLEPRYETKGTMLIGEDGEVTEVVFLMKGQYKVGYRLPYMNKYFVKIDSSKTFDIKNLMKMYGRKMKNEDKVLGFEQISASECLPIGAYELAFGKSSDMVYRTTTEAEGFIIRGIHFKRILEDYKPVTDVLKDNIKEMYIGKIKKRRDVALISYVKKAHGVEEA